MADEWRAQAFGYAGDTNARTPTFDRFAGESLNFTEAVSSCPVCCPARASLMSGQYALTHGVYINDVPFEPKTKTLAEVFRDSGYSTAYIGKWHLYGSPDGHYGRREAYIPPDKRFGFDYWKVGECTHNYNHSFYYEGDDPTKKYWPGYDAIAQTEDASRFILEHSKSEKPYFLMLSWGPPHFPLNSAPEQYKNLYENKEIALRPNVAPNKKAEAIEDLRGYYAHIAALDDCFKRLLETVEASGTSNDTIIVFTSDHGDMMESQGLTAKLYPWEESARIPLLIRYPDNHGRTGKRSHAPVSTPDIMPMILGLSKLPIPDGVQGTNYCAGPSVSANTGSSKTAFLNMPVPITTARNYGIAEYRGVRSATHTYVRSIHGPWLLYDNKRDPYQMENLCNHPDSKHIQAEMEGELNVWLKALKDDFLPANTYLERDRLTNYMEPYAAVTFTRSPWGDWQSTLPSRTLSVDSPLFILMADPRVRILLDRDVPQLDVKRNPKASLRQLQHMGLAITDEKLQQIDEQLKQIPPARDNH
jgi:arylsulfatase A-like enzyme